MLGLADANLDKPEIAVPALQSLGRRHVAFGTRAAHDAPVGAALLSTLGQGLGPGFAPEVREAWTGTCGLVSRVIMEAAGS